MSTLFEERKRAAEYGYSHAEELSFLALREGVEALAHWASGAMGQADAAGAEYAAALVGRLVGGASEVSLVAQVREDLEVAGRSELVREAGSRFIQAVAKASGRLHGTLAPRREPAARRVIRPASHPHDFWGWTV